MTERTPQSVIERAKALYSVLQSSAKVGAAMGVSKRTARKYLDLAGVIRDRDNRIHIFADESKIVDRLIEAGYFPAPGYKLSDIGQTHPTSDNFGRLVLSKLPNTILVIPDLQAPYHNQSTLPFLDAVAQRFSPDCIVGIGDEVDLNFLSRYEKFPEIDEPARELDAARKFMGDLFRLFPKAHALTSNHVHGRLQSARRIGRLPPQMLVPWKSLIEAPPGWEWYEEVHLGSVLFRHGDKWPKLTTTHLQRDIPRCYGRHMSVVHGHLHTQHGRVGDTILVGDDEYWAAYTGSLIDTRSKAFDYVKAPQIRLGCLVIHHGVPHRIPLRRDADGRWTGKL